MDRRALLALFGSGLIAPHVMAGAQERPTNDALSLNIAVWGDSLTDLYQWNLSRLYGTKRQVFNGGVPGETSQQIRQRMVADRAHAHWICVFWYGHNNFVKAEVNPDIVRSVAALAPGNHRFIVMPMLSWATDGRKGSPMYDQVVRAGAELGALYPHNYLDIRAHLLRSYDRNSAQDMQDVQSGITPSSLRFDAIHLNTAGCNTVAARVAEFIVKNGW